MTIFSVSQKISDSGNAEKVFLLIEYVRYIYRTLFDGSKLTENTGEK